MTVKIDSLEVLSHLNKYGIRTIDEDSFKLFMKDLKKLIKYEQRKKEATESNSPRPCSKKLAPTCRESEVGCNCDIRISSCCPENCATVTYVHQPRKINQEFTSVCKDAGTSGNNDLLPKNIAKSTSSLYGTNQYKNKRRKVNDPVELYHYYQSIWKHHKLPGENDHSQLRQAIRNRLMNVK